MIDVITTDDLHRLAGTTREPCVSIFVPTHRAGPETTQDRIRLKNLVSTATDELRATGMRNPDVQALLAPVTALDGDSTFWAHSEEGLALYVNPDTTFIVRLGVGVPELVTVAERFHLKPLLPALEKAGTYYVLAFSQKRVRLLSGGRYGLVEESVPDLPTAMSEVLDLDDREPQLQSHSANRIGAGTVAATFHGQGGAAETHDADLARFLRAVDDALTTAMPATRSPLVLAAVDELIAAYGAVSRWTEIVDGHVRGNPDALTALTLHERSWPLAEAHLDQPRRAAEQACTDGSVPTAHGLADALLAAAEGRVASLFVPIDHEVWGSFDTSDQKIEVYDERRPGARDLCDVAAIETVMHGGTVFTGAAADLPGGGPITALLRY